MASVSEYKTQVDAVVTAIGDGDYDAAHVALVKARVLLEAIPDMKAGEFETRYRPSNLDSLEKSLDKLESRAGTTNKIRTTTTTYVNPSTS